MTYLSRETEALAQRLADMQGIPVDAAVRQALEAQALASGVSLDTSVAARDRSTTAIAARRASLSRIVDDLSSMPVLDRRTSNAMIDDINGL